MAGPNPDDKNCYMTPERFKKVAESMDARIRRDAIGRKYFVMYTHIGIVYIVEDSRE